MRFSFRLLIMLAGLSVPASNLSAQSFVPESINYQGTLVDVLGDPLPDGNYNLEFNIFSANSGGILVWGPRIYDSSTAVGHDSLVPVIGGQFNVILGPIDVNSAPLSTAFDGSFANNDQRFVEVTVNGTPFPRQQILSVPFAYDPFGKVPLGAILAHHLDIAGAADAAAVIAAGFAFCDGTDAVSQGVINPVITATLPDLNIGNGLGRFLRGTTGTTGVLQTDQMQNHTHNVDQQAVYSATTPDHNHSASHPHTHEFNLSTAASGSSNNAEGVSGGTISKEDTFGASDEDVTVDNKSLTITVSRTTDAEIGGPTANGGGTPRLGSETRPVSMTVVWIMRVR
jgi:hypothetical protein